MTEVTNALQSVRDRIGAAARRCGRDPAEIRLVAVSKTRPPSLVEEALASGQRDFGENYLQEALEKIQTLAGQAARWHFIGRIQRNKTAAIATHFDWVQTVDRPQIAERLSRQRGHYQAPLQVCIQVRLADDPARPGVDPAELAALATQVAGLERLRLRGLMAMPPLETDPVRQRAHFERLATLAAQLRAPGQPLDTLSMGTTGDLDAAVAAGSTMVRIGTAVFGPRG